LEGLNAEAGPLSHIKPGEFVYFSDNLKGCCTQIGLLKLSETQYFLRIFNQNVDVISTLELKKEGPIYQFMPVTGDPKNMMPILYGLNLMNYFLYVKSEIEKSKPGLKEILVIWPAYKKRFQYTIGKWASFFKFVDGRDLDSKDVFKISAVGRVTKAEDVDTFKKFGVYGANAVGDNVTIKPASPKRFKLQDAEILVDGNWLMRTDQTAIDLKPMLGNDGKENSFAWIEMQRVDFSGDFEALLSRMLHTHECILLDDSRIDIENRRMEFTRYIGNTILLKMFVKIRGGPKKYSSIKLTVTRDVYTRNKEYFDNIINALQP